MSLLKANIDHFMFNLKQLSSYEYLLPNFSDTKSDVRFILYNNSFKLFSLQLFFSELQDL